VAREAIGLRVLAVGLVMTAAVQLVRPVQLPLFDGVVVVDPYRYLSPPAGGEGSPTSAKATFPIEAGKSPSFAVYTSETPPQAELLAKGGELAVGSGSTSVTVTIDPVPPPGASSSQTIAGNVYRVAIVDQSGAAVGLAASQTITVALRGPPGTAVDATIARFTDGAWQPVKTAPSGLQDLFLTNAEALGEFAVLGHVTPSANGLDPGLLIWALVAAGLIVLVAWRFGGTSNPLVQSNLPAGRRSPRKKRDKT
jgi:hypothetical protein